MKRQGEENMYCNKCGKQIDDNSKFCSECGNPINKYQPTNVESMTKVQPKSDNTKIYCVLSYIGILWLIGLFLSPEKNDPKVRFHVGQGIILTIASVVLNIIKSILSMVINIFAKVTFNIFGIGIAGRLLYIFTTLLSIVFAVGILALMIIGIVNAVNGEQKPLPIIGKLSFYK